MKTYVFDIDGTICTNTNGDYKNAKPYIERIHFINKLYDDGNIIKYFTARGSTTGIDWRKLTVKQLKEWKAQYHELILGKPDGDLFIDDKGFNCERWIFPLGGNMKQEDPNSFNFELRKLIQNHIEVMTKIGSDNFINSQINQLCNEVNKVFEQKGKIIFAGNGGSFSDSQHLAAEFVCRFKNNRSPLGAISLGTNSSNLTAIGNDYGFDHIFSRELRAIANPEDILVALSTSGNSENIINLIEEAVRLGIPFFILSGENGGKLSVYQERVIRVPSADTAIIQQAHIIIGHHICSQTESKYIITK